MLDRRLDRESNAAWRYWLEQEAVHLAPVNEVHQHVAIFTAARNDRDESFLQRLQVLCQFFDVRANQSGVHDADTNRVGLDQFLRGLDRTRRVHVLHAAAALLDRFEKRFVFGHDQNGNGLCANGRRLTHLLRIQCRVLPGPVADDRRAVVVGLHDDVLAGPFRRLGGLVVGRFRDRHQAHLLGRFVDEFGDVFRVNAAANDLEDLFVPDESLGLLIVLTGDQDADRLRGTFLRFTQRIGTAHARQVAG